MKSFGHIRISISATSSICCASQLAMHQVHAVHHVNFTINHAFHRTASRIAVCKLDSCVWLLCSAERPNQVQSISCQHCTSSLHCRVQKQCKGCKIGGGIELAELVHFALNTNTNTWKSANLTINYKHRSANKLAQLHKQTLLKNGFPLFLPLFHAHLWTFVWNDFPYFHPW